MCVVTTKRPKLIKILTFVNLFDMGNPIRHNNYSYVCVVNILCYRRWYDVEVI